MKTRGKRLPDELRDEMIAELHRLVAKMAQDMERSRFSEYVRLLDNPRKLIWVNLLAGTSRGVGIAIGLSVFTSTILYILRAIGALDLPIIGDYITEIVDHVQRQLEMRRY